MKLAIQFLIVFSICFIGEIISGILPFAFPSSVLSMFILLILLLIKFIQIKDIKELTDYLLKNMAFFFIPSGVSIIKYTSAFEGIVISFLLVCIITTFITFFITSLTVRFTMKIMKRGVNHD